MSFDYSALITDRTAADLSRWQALRDKGWANMTTEEKAEWASGMKGAYKPSDLNRVGNALNNLRDRLAAAGYISANAFTAKTSWTDGEVPTGADLTYYLNCVSVIREAMAQFSTTPPAPEDTGSLTIQEANGIEQIALDIDQLIRNMLAARFFSNDLYSGEI